MATIADLVVNLRAQTTQFKKEMASAQASLKGVDDASTKSARTLKTVAKVGFAAAGLAALKFAADSARAASDQEEALNKVGVVFAGTSKRVMDFAETSATAAGISKTAALEASAGFGQMLQTAGLAADASAEMSVELVQLAADLASFNNIDPSEALEKLRSGLAGEAEPLRTLGVFLSEARVQSEAFSSGIAEVGAELTEAQKVQARYNLILKDTTLAQGDFARTADSAANQQRALAAEFENMQAEVGQALLPVMKELLGLVRDLIPLFKLFAQGVGLIAKAVSPVIGLLDGMGDEMREFNDLMREASEVSPEFAAKAEELGNGLIAIGKGGSGARTVLRQMAEETLTATRHAESLTGALAARDRVMPTYIANTSSATRETRKLSAAHKAAAEAAREQKIAEDILAGGLLGLAGASRGVREAQMEVNRLRRNGKTETNAFRNAQLDLLAAQLTLRESAAELVTQMRENDASAKDVKAAFRNLAREAGLTKGDTTALWKDIQQLTTKMNGVPRRVHTRVTADTSQAMAALQAVADRIRALEGLTGGFATQAREGGSVPAFGDGGYVSRPTLAIVGEKGPEYIIPAREIVRRGDSRAGRTVVNVDRRRFAGSLAYDSTFRGW